MKKVAEKGRYYVLREQGMTQREAASLLNVSERTCRRWEREAREQVDNDTANARKAYSAHLEQKKSLMETYKRLEDAILAIDFNNLSDAQKLDFVLKYGRRIDELENKAPQMPVKMQLSGLAELDRQSGNNEIVELQEQLFNAAMRGEISDEQARKKILLLSELRKSVAQNDNFF